MFSIKCVTFLLSDFKLPFHPSCLSWIQQFKVSRKFELNTCHVVSERSLLLCGKLRWAPFGGTCVPPGGPSCKLFVSRLPSCDACGWRWSSQLELYLLHIWIRGNRIQLVAGKFNGVKFTLLQRFRSVIGLWLAMNWFKSWNLLMLIKNCTSLHQKPPALTIQI